MKKNTLFGMHTAELRVGMAFLFLFVAIMPVAAQNKGKSIDVFCQFDYQKAMDAVECTNRERINKGLKPYLVDSTLMELAMIRAAEMKGTNNFSHVRPNGESALNIIQCKCQKGENIAYGQTTGKEVVAQWMTSTGHRGNILNKEFDCIGIGVCDKYWVQLFMKSGACDVVLFKDSLGRIADVTVSISLDPKRESVVVNRNRGK